MNEWLVVWLVDSLDSLIGLESGISKKKKIGKPFGNVRIEKKLAIIRAAVDKNINESLNVWEVLLLWQDCVFRVEIKTTDRGLSNAGHKRHKRHKRNGMYFLYVTKGNKGEKSTHH